VVGVGQQVRKDKAEVKQLDKQFAFFVRFHRLLLYISPFPSQANSLTVTEGWAKGGVEHLQWQKQMAKNKK